MVLNFTDPFLTTRVLGFESLFDRLQRFSETTERSSSYPPYNIRRDQNQIFIDVAVFISLYCMYLKCYWRNWFTGHDQYVRPVISIPFWKLKADCRLFSNIMLTPNIYSYGLPIIYRLHFSTNGNFKTYQWFIKLFWNILHNVHNVLRFGMK